MMQHSKSLIVGLILLVILGLATFYYFKEETKSVVVEGWKTQVDKVNEVQFMYPESIGKIYVSTVDWPPTAKVSDDKFSCSGATVETGESKLVKVNGSDYCVTQVSEGAAGSTYTQYAYEKGVNGETVTLTFTLKYPQCLNYNEPTQTECATEQTSFNLNNLVDQIFGTLKFI